MDDQITVIGYVGKDGPTSRTTSKGEVVSFSMGVKVGDGTRWYEVTVWPKGPQAEVLREVRPGSHVAVTGVPKVREYNGRTYHQLWSFGIGFYEPIRAPRAEETSEEAW